MEMDPESSSAPQKSSSDLKKKQYATAEPRPDNADYNHQ